MFRLLVLVYADDTVVFADTPEGLRVALRALEQYCELWKLKINVDKTSVIIFARRRANHNEVFTLYGKNIEIVDRFKYLGVNFASMLVAGRLCPLRNI